MRPPTGRVSAPDEAILGLEEELVSLRQAARLLGLSPGDVTALRDAGVLQTVRQGRVVALTSGAVLAVSRRPQLDVRASVGTLCGIVLNLRPPERDKQRLDGRRHRGWAASDDLPETAWTGWYDINADMRTRVLGGVVVATIAGVVVEVRRIVGFRTLPIGRSGRELSAVDVASASDAEVDRYANSRLPLRDVSWYPLLS